MGPDLGAGVPEASLVENTPLAGHVGGEATLLVRSGNEYFAIGATCTHYGGPLAEGLVDGATVRCPWHHAKFCLRTGDAIGAPALTEVASYEVERRDGKVFVTRRRDRVAAPSERSAPHLPPPSVGIIGAGAGGTCVALELRRLGYTGAVTLIDRDGDAPYDRPNLSKDYLAGTQPRESLPLVARTDLEQQYIELLLGRTVTQLDATRRRITFDDGTHREFGAIVLAPGADPVRIEVPGEQGPPIHYVRSLKDSDAIIKSAAGAQRAVVIGASFIGLETAAALRTRGLEVHVVGLEPRPLERVLGGEFGDFVRQLHESHGVVFHLGTKVATAGLKHVTLENGERLDADFIVAGVGVRPATGLAEAAGLAVDKGIVVDAYLETSSKGVFAIGDSARWPSSHTGGLVRIEHWVLAQRQGQAVARTLMGDRKPFVDVPFFWSQHYDIAINYVGHAEQWDRLEIDGKLADHDCSARYWVGRKLMAVASIFRDRESLEAELAMERQVSGA